MFQQNLILILTIIICCFVISCSSKKNSEKLNSEKLNTSGEELEPFTDESKTKAGKKKKRTAKKETAKDDYETPPELKASEILPPELMKSDNHEVLEQVSNDCYWNSYIVHSTYGEYSVYSTRFLKIRIKELEALSVLKKTSSVEALARGTADTVIVHPFRSAMNVATKPVETVKGVPGGIVSFFKNIYYTGEWTVSVAKTVGERAITHASGGEEGQNGPGISEDINAIADWYLGVGAGEREIARRLGVDPYTSNPLLAEEIKRVSKYERIGKLGISFAPIPSIPGMGYVKDVNYYVWDKDPKELREFNKKQLIKMGIDEALVLKFIDSPFYSPTYQTTIVLSLKELDGVNNREEILEDAIVAGNIQESQFYTNLVVLLTWFHLNHSSLKTIINHADITSAQTNDNRIITIIPADYLCWSEAIAEAANFHSEVMKDIQAKEKELWVAGKTSEMFDEKMKNLGWEVVNDISPLAETEEASDDQIKEKAIKQLNEGLIEDIIELPKGDEEQGIEQQ